MEAKLWACVEVWAWGVSLLLKLLIHTACLILCALAKRLFSVLIARLRCLHLTHRGEFGGGACRPATR